MVKSILIYTLFLAVIDFFINLAINLIFHEPVSVVVVSVILRAICLFMLFPFVGVMMFMLLKGMGSNMVLIFTTFLVYCVIPMVIYSLKENNKSILETYIDCIITLGYLPLYLCPTL